MQKNIKYKRLKVGRKYIEAIAVKLLSKSFILLRGDKGYIMCGYLDLAVAEKFGDVAARIVGVSTIEEALGAKVDSLSRQAIRLGIRKDELVKEALKKIA